MTPNRKVYPAVDERDFLGRILTDILALDSRIQWVAIEEAGRPPRWVWRDLAQGGLLAGTGACGNELLDPLILILAEGPEAIYG